MEKKWRVRWDEISIKNYKKRLEDVRGIERWEDLRDRMNKALVMEERKESRRKNRWWDREYKQKRRESQKMLKEVSDEGRGRKEYFEEKSV